MALDGRDTMCGKLLERQREVERYTALAKSIDAAAARLARGRPAIDVALGEVFCRLSKGELLLDVGFAKTTDFANELGIPPREYFELLKLGKALSERPLLRQAMLAGEVTTVKAFIVLDLAVGEEEAVWVARAMEETVAGLKRLAKEKGGTGGEEGPCGYETLRLAMTPAQQDRLDYALFLAGDFVGFDAPRWRLWEELRREWMEFRQRSDVDIRLLDTKEKKKLQATREEFLDRKDEIRRQLEIHLEAMDFVREEAPKDENAFGLKALAKRLLRRRRKFDEPLGRLLLQIKELELWRWLGWESLGHYCRERLGISESTVRERVRLEKRMVRLPALRQALVTGRLTYTKAVQVARHATPQDIDERIAEAASTTHQQTKAKADREEDRKDRERGVKKVRGPAAALAGVREAIASARQFFAVRGEEISPGEAWSRIGDHYIARWEVPLNRHGWRKQWEREVMLRHGGLCAVPGCTRAAKDVHHVVFRKHGGQDMPWNGIAVCNAHHTKCLHGKRLVVRGRGGEHLLWIVKDREATPREQWETRGADDVRRRPLGPAA